MARQEALGGFKLERLWSDPGTLLNGSWPLLARPGRLQIGLELHLSVQKPSRVHPDTEAALGARTRPRSSFGQFF